MGLANSGRDTEVTIPQLLIKIPCETAPNTGEPRPSHCKASPKSRIPPRAGKRTGPIPTPQPTRLSSCAHRMYNRCTTDAHRNDCCASVVHLLYIRCAWGAAPGGGLGHMEDYLLKSNGLAPSYGLVAGFNHFGVKGRRRVIHQPGAREYSGLSAWLPGFCQWS
jgi:hypothetical protein